MTTWHSASAGPTAKTDCEMDLPRRFWQQQQITLGDEEAGEEKEGGFLPRQDVEEAEAGDLLGVEKPEAGAHSEDIGKSQPAADGEGGNHEQ